MPQSPAARRTAVSIAIAALLALVALAVWWANHADALRPAAPDAPRTAAARPSHAEPHSAEPDPVRDPAAPDAATALVAEAAIDLDHPFAFALDVRIVDAFGLPVPDAEVFLAPPLCGFSRWREATDRRGHAAVQWRGRLREMPVQIAVLAYGVIQPIRQFQVVADEPQHVCLVARGTAQDEKTLQYLRERSYLDLEHDRRRVAYQRERLRRTDDLDLLCGRRLALFSTFDCQNCHEPSLVGTYATLARSGLMTRGLHPHAVFQDLRHAPSPEEAKAEEVARVAELSQRRHTMASDDLRPGEEDAEPGKAMVSGQMRNPDGKPAALVAVAALGEHGELLARTMTNTSGTYRLGPLDPGAVALVAGGGDGGQAQTLQQLLAGDGNRWNADLIASGRLRGVARGENGGVLAGWRVEIDGLRGEWADATTTDESGAFAFTGLTAACEALLWPVDSDLELPVVYGRTALPDGLPIALALDAAVPTRGRLRVHVAWSKQQSLNLDARLCQLDTGRVAQLAALQQDAALELGGLPAGPYQLAIGSPVTGWIDCGVTQIDGRGLWDLGEVVPRRPGTVHVRLPRDVDSFADVEHAFYRRTPAVDVQAAERPLGPDRVSLPAGELVFVWRHPDLHTRLVNVVSDAVVELDLREP